MPDLGTYAGPVLGAYAVTLALIVGLVVVSVSQAARARRQLEAAEKLAREARHG